MSPSTIKFLDGDDQKQRKTTRSGVVMNGPRPTPLKLKQESHTIYKPSRHHQIHHQQEQKKKMMRKPVIIYIRSPEVIHTKPHDFMALVQKLTGAHHHNSSSASKHDQQHKKTNMKKQADDHEGASSLYDLNDDINHELGAANSKHMKSSSPIKFNTPQANPHPHIYDIPLFTPNYMTDNIFSPQRFF